MLNLVQKFSFETDSLDDIAAMLGVIVPTVFKYPNGEYTQKHVVTEEKNPYWNNGSDFVFSSIGIMEHDKKVYSIDRCATYGGAAQYRILQEHRNLDDAAKIASETKRLPPTRLFLAKLGDSKSAYANSKDHAIKCRGNDSMINEAVKRAKTAPKVQFEQLRTPEWMEYGDGSIRMGYRLAAEYDCGSQVLILSACHIFYGK